MEDQCLSYAQMYPGSSLETNGTQFNDGFREIINSVRYWNPDLLEQRCSNIRLFKLHGSINWFRFRPEGGDWSNKSIGIPLEWGLWQIANAVERRPMLLVGTFNKILEYTSSIYADLHYQLYHSLHQIKDLIICGCGFGDRGINTRIIEWIYSSSAHRIIVIHPKPEKLKNSARGSIRNKWNDWISKKKLVIIPKKIEEIPWQELNDILPENF